MDQGWASYKSDLRKRLDRSYRELDRIIIIIATSLLVFSLNFFYSSDLTFKWVSLIQVSWVLFTIAILGVILSLRAEHKHKNYILNNENNNSNLGLKIDLYNKFTVICFVCAKVSFLIFFLVNVNK